MAQPGVHTSLSSQEVWPGPLGKGALENSKPPHAPLHFTVSCLSFVVVDVNNKRMSKPSIDSTIFAGV